MTAQISYTINQGVALAGLLFSLENKTISSRAAEGAAGIEFGFPVSRGTDKDKQVTLGGTDFFGFAVRSLEREGVYGTGATKYDEKETVGCLRSGSLWVPCVAGCVPGDTVKYDSTTGAVTTGTAGVGEVQLDGAVWDTTAAAGELAVLRIETSDFTVGS